MTKNALWTIELFIGSCIGRKRHRSRAGSVESVPGPGLRLRQTHRRLAPRLRIVKWATSDAVREQRGEEALVGFGLPCNDDTWLVGLFIVLLLAWSLALDFYSLSYFHTLFYLPWDEHLWGFGALR